MKSISVFCGSSSGVDPDFQKAAHDLGVALAEAEIELVYGGASVGLMGVLADATLSAGGQVVGVLPRFLATKEIAHGGLSDLIMCDSMHARKVQMFERSEGFIALPGGFGTLEEISEILTWRQLGLHHHPIGLLNVNGFYDSLLEQFEKMRTQALLKEEHRQMVMSATGVAQLLEMLQSYTSFEQTGPLADKDST